MLSAGFLLGALSWMLASLLDFFTLGTGGLLQHVIHPSLDQLFIRSIMFCLFVIFGSHSQFVMDQRRKSEILEKARIKADAANKAKSEFLASMSHEIRTPLNALIGLIDIVLETPLDNEQRDDLKVARSAAHTLLSLINDILDFSRIEA